MKYVLIDPRKGFQIAYVGQTNNFDKRIQGHYSDYCKSVIIYNYSLVNGFKSSSMKEKWFSEMSKSQVCYEVFKIDEQDKYSESAWTKAFDTYFNMTNNKADITNARNRIPFGTDRAETFPVKEVSLQDFNKVIEKIKKKILHLNLMKKIPIAEYEFESKYSQYEYTWYTYLPKNLNHNEEQEFIKEYNRMHDLIEDVASDYHNNRRYTIMNWELYKLDTPAKIAIIRDYFNNDLYRAILEDEIIDDLDEQYLAEDLHLLINNKIFPENKHYDILKEITQYCNSPGFNFFKEWVNIKEILG